MMVFLSVVKEAEFKNILDGERRIWFLLIIVIILLAVLGFIGKDYEIAKIKNEYSIESKILLNELSERAELRKQEWDLNEWIIKHNEYLENHLNYLLLYNDEEMRNFVVAEEKCLADLYYYYEIKEAGKMAETAEKCNAINREIEKRHAILLNKKLEGI